MSNNSEFIIPFFNSISLPSRIAHIDYRKISPPYKMLRDEILNLKHIPNYSPIVNKFFFLLNTSYFEGSTT